MKQDTKRQRTNSESIEGGSTLLSNSLDSDDEAHPARLALKKARSAASGTQRQRELRDKDVVREAHRAEAAGRRTERAGRRRGADEGGQ